MDRKVARIANLGRLAHSIGFKKAETNKLISSVDGKKAPSKALKQIENQKKYRQRSESAMHRKNAMF